MEWAALGAGGAALVLVAVRVAFDIENSVAPTALPIGLWLGCLFRMKPTNRRPALVGAGTSLLLVAASPWPGGAAADLSLAGLVGSAGGVALYERWSHRVLPLRNSASALMFVALAAVPAAVLPAAMAALSGSPLDATTAILFSCLLAASTVGVAIAAADAAAVKDLSHSLAMALVLVGLAAVLLLTVVAPTSWGLLFWPLSIWAALRLGALATAALATVPAVLSMSGWPSWSQLELADAAFASCLTVALLAPVILAVAVAELRQSLVELRRHRDTLAAEHAELSGRVDRLARRNDDLQRFAYVAAHDLQEPLRTASGFCELLRDRRGDTLDVEARLWLDHAAVGIRRMRRLVADMLRLARVGSESRPLSAVDLDAVMISVRASLGAAIDASAASIVIGPLPTVRGDRSQLAQMFVNLMGNALKYAGTEAPRVTVTAERAADGWWLCVADCGIGIAAEHHAAIFEPLVRLPGSEGHDGCGLGLAIVRRVVERHGGRIRVESAVGQGSRFLVFLPEAPISGAPPGTV